MSNFQNRFEKIKELFSKRVILKASTEQLRKEIAELNTIVSPYKAVKEAQQKRVYLGILPELKRNWTLALSFLRHTQEELFEVIRELPRREWKNQEIVEERVLEEMADVYIQFLTSLLYTGFTKEELDQALYKKLGQAKHRKDWKDNQ